MGNAIDNMMKTCLLATIQQETEATCNEIARRVQNRLDFIQKVLTVDEPTATAAINALNPRGDGPTIYPPSSATVSTMQPLYVSFSLPPAGKILRYSIGNSLETTPAVTADSPVWTLNQGTLEIDSMPLVLKGQFYDGTTPISAQSVAVWGIPMDLALIRIVRNACALSNKDVAKHIAINLSLWLAPELRNDPAKRTAFLNALTYRHQNAIAALNVLSYQQNHPYIPPDPGEGPPVI